MTYADSLSVDEDSLADVADLGINSNSKFYYPHNLKSPLSDSSLSGLPSYVLDGSMGIDRLVIGVVVDPDSIALNDFLPRIFGEGNKTRGAVQLPGFPSIWVSWPDTSLRPYMKIDFNPSNFSRLDGFEICPPPLLLYYVQQVILLLLDIGDSAARPKFMESYEQGVIGPWPQNWPNEIMLFEVHYARDFLITSDKFHLEQLQDIKPKKARGVCAIRDGGTLETVTHVHAKDSPVHKFYDKHREREQLRKSKKRWNRTFESVPQGTFRYEIELPRRTLRSINHKDLSVLTVDRMIKTVRSYWKTSNYHQPLVWEGRALQDLLVKLGHEEAAKVLMYAHATNLGITNFGTPKEQRRYLRRLREFRLKVSKAFWLQGAPYGHLDFELGRLIEY